MPPPWLEAFLHNHDVLRITANTSETVVVKLEGRLVGPWVNELKKTVLRTNGRCQPLEIDVSDLTFADDKGERALRWLHRMGAHFQGKAPFSEYLFERLKIPLFAAGIEGKRPVVEDCRKPCIEVVVDGRGNVKQRSPITAKPARTGVEEH